MYLFYHIYYKYSNRLAWANSLNLDQTAPSEAFWSWFTLLSFYAIFYTPYCKVVKWASTPQNLSSGFPKKVKFKPACSATETIKKIEISLEASLGMILSNKQITKALISLCRLQTGLLLCCLQTTEDRFFSQRGPNRLVHIL